MNNSREAGQIRALLQKLITATCEEDYDTILPCLYEKYNNPDLSERELKELYADSFLGNYLGDSDISLKKVAFVYSIRDQKTREKSYTFEVTLSNGRYNAIRFYERSIGEWVMSTSYIPYFY